MKKLLGVSLFAVLTATPMLARADKTIAELPLQNGGNVPVSTQVATTSYVKGAYNSVANAVNAVVNDMTVADGEYSHINPTKSVGENLVLLNNAINNAAGTSSTTYTTKESAAATLASGADTLHYVTANGEAVGANLGNLDAAVFANESAITLLNSADTVEGSVAYAVKTEQTRAENAELELNNRIGTLDADKNYLRTANDVYTNMTALDTQVHNNEVHIGSMDSLRSTGNMQSIESRSTLVSAINTLDAAISSAGTASNVTSGHYIGTENGKNSVSENLTALDTQVHNNAEKIGTTNMGTTATTVTGAIKEMHDQKLEVATTWNSAATAEINLFEATGGSNGGD